MKVFGVIALTFAFVTAAAADQPSDQTNAAPLPRMIYMGAARYCLSRGWSRRSLRRDWRRAFRAVFRLPRARRTRTITFETFSSPSARSEIDP